MASWPCGPTPHHRSSHPYAPGIAQTARGGRSAGNRHGSARQERGQGVILLELLEWVFLLVFVLFIATQVLLPLWQDAPYFPFFRRQARALRIRKVLRILEDTVPDGQPRGED